VLADDRPDIRDRSDVARLVVAFYRAAAMDDLLGPVFEAAHVDWSVHTAKLTDFWAWQLLGQPADERNPLLAHQSAHARTPFTEQHYERWLDLFETTVDELFAGSTAAAAKRRGWRMAKAMRRLLDDRPSAGDAPTEVMWARHSR
jgi:hemoglobin